MKLCKDCVHRRNPTWWFPECDAPQNRIVSPVTGKWKHKRWKYCDAHRIGSPAEDNCGELGAWWEPRPGVVRRVIEIFSRS